MYAQVLAVTLRILAFRAGPQDFPFDPRLTMPLVLIAGGANAMLFAQVLPLPTALTMAAAMVGGTALVTRSVLRARDVPERFNQTFNTLLATAAALTLLMLPLFAQMAPVLRELAGKPELLEQPDVMQVPQGLAFLMNLINFWNLAVTAFVFRHAANVQLWLGVVIALILAFVVLFCVIFAGLIAGVLFGAGAAPPAPSVLG
ncbi:hypothetical protein [Sinimarinibacterium thermocellulolyticum]|uniref:Yip1 domain-containing protein n=1 Tax=Sinimarinibacterium thermocellulolyticum TaxID=3170016 RepID=A0ABV2A6U2_9GAMM